MSYILEALRRAERERDTGKAPSVESLNRGGAEIDRPRVPPSIWALAIATAVIACIALAILLWPHAQPKAPASEPLATSPAPQSAVEPARASAPTVQAYAAVPTATPTAIEDRDDVISLDDVTGDAVDAPAAADAGGPAAAAPIEPEDTAADPASAPSAISAPNPAAAPDTDHAAIMVPAGVTVLREMPASYREQFPVQTLDVHVYNPDPAKRWVMIAGTRYREGQTVASGPQIAQITEAGVVFDYQGARVLLPIR